MILGDGNLSFSLAFARLNPQLLIVATVIEANLNEFCLRYPSGYNTFKKLKYDCANSLVKFGVDATCLQDFLPSCNLLFKKIIMNFPHPGRKTNLAANRRLLNNIFFSIATQLPNKFCFYLTLANGQSGLENKPKEIFSNRLPHHKADSWQAIYLAANYGLKLVHRRLFSPKKFAEYSCTGYLNRDQYFHNKIRSDTLVFVKVDDYEEKNLISLKSLENDKELLKPVIQRNFALKIFHLQRPYFIHDISVLYKISDVKDCLNYMNAIDRVEQTCLIPIVIDLTGKLLVDFYEVIHLRGECPKTHMKNRVYRMVWQGWFVLLNKNLCNNLQNEFREVLKERFALINGNNKLLLN